jgi:hypothetical protein
LRKRFWRTLIAAICLFLTLVVERIFLVADVPVLGGEQSVAFVVGFSRPVQPPCGRDVSDADCIKMLSFNPSRIESFWGDRQIRLARLLLLLSYVSFMSCFGSMVGLLLLRESAQTRRKAAAAQPRGQPKP